jgi:hypothetical protein
MGSAWLAAATLFVGACAAARPPVAEQPLSAASQRPSAGGAPKHNTLDEHALEAVLDKRVDEVMARPAIDRAFEQMLESVADDKALGEQAEGLMSELGDAPEIASRAAAIEEAIGEAPQMTALAVRLMAENPNASPEQIGALAGDYISRQLDSPLFDRALERAIDHFLEQAALKAAFDEFGDVTSNNPHVVRSLSQALRSVDEDKLEKRLTELNGGSKPDHARTIELLETHAFTVDRIERLMLDWIGLSETREEVRRLAGELLQAPAFRGHVLRLFSQLLSDSAFQHGLETSFVLLLEPNPDSDVLVREFGRVLETRSTTAACSNFVTALTRDPALQAIGDRTLARLTTSPAFIASFQRFATGW